jgi:hypothetical protein
MDAMTVSSLGGALLEGMSFGDSAGFEAWLVAERQRAATDARWALREAALGRLGRGEANEAIPLASKLVAIDPLNESAHELLIRSLAAAGEDESVRNQLERAIALIRDELGVEPGQDLMAACDSLPSPEPKAPEPARVQAAIETGLAAAFAAQGASLDAVRQALIDARAIGNPDLLMRALHLDEGARPGRRRQGRRGCGGSLARFRGHAPNARPGAYPWIRAYALDALCGVAVNRHLPGAPAWIADLEERAARLGMRELLVRAHLHRWRLGDDRSLEVARSLSAEIDNPALERELDG